ncbi:MAG: hypothetical protein HY335_07040, partial [Deinococcus sp.]|nr:hypothetical protein [Deinococcus sp.]
LFYLLEAPRRRDEIIEALWEGEELKTATASVHSTVHRLRKAISPIEIPYEDGWYRLAAEQRWLDASEFDRLAEQGLASGQIQDLEAAVALYGGQYLEEFYSTWCSRRREDLEARYTEVLAKLSEIYAQRGEYEKTVRSAKGALDRDPYREELHRRVMEAYWAQGNRVAAVRHYQSYVKLLAEELNVEPLPETAELYQQILQG